MQSFLASIILFVVLSLSQLPPSPPDFSWDTVPLFIHAMNESGALNETAAKYMASFPLATIEKAQGQSKENPVCNDNEGEECKIVAALKQIRGYSSSVRTLFYLNTVLNYPQYNLSKSFTGKNEKYLLHDDKTGELVYYDTCHPNGPHQTIFDFSYNYTREAWVNTVRYAMTKSPGAVDGIFADKARATTSRDFGCLNWNQTHAQEWQNGHTSMLQESMKVIFENDKDRGIIMANEADLPGLDGRMFQGFQQDDKDAVPPGPGIELLINETGHRVVEVHGPDCTFFNQEYNQTLAAYLIGAFKYSYYMCTHGWTIQDGWDIAWQNPDFKKPLGEPLGNATLEKGVYHRAFKQGVKVWIDQQWDYPCIKWADGSITGSKADCDKYS